MRYQLSLTDMESDIMRDQLKGLYEAVNHIGEGKKQADKKQAELNTVQKALDEVKFEKSVEEHDL